MACTEHKALAEFIKGVHSSLRTKSLNVGADKAWLEHCKNEQTLKEYADCMQELASTFWEENSANKSKTACSRIKWAADMIFDYFINETYIVYRNKEIEIAAKIDINVVTIQAAFHSPISFIDVGSCYNPFKKYDFLNVLAIDLCPANEDVMQCDLLNVTIGRETLLNNKKVAELKECSFEALTFCFVLEYIPSSQQRIEACRQAYRLLKPEGLMVIATPDSKHVGANSKIMKCWRFALAKLGFMRVKYEKFPHMHCMAFRKSLYRETAERWCILHHEPYMTFEMNIPQDFQSTTELSPSRGHDEIKTNISSSSHDFLEMPFFNEYFEL